MTETTPDIEKCLRIIELYFSPWGAAKAAEWENLLGDGFYGPETALRAIHKILGGTDVGI